MSHNYAPIALFAYNRPDHLKLTIEALRNNVLADKSELFIFCDGAKNEKSYDSAAEVRAYAKTVSGFKSVKVFEKEKNFGLAQSIILGVTEIVNKFGRIIVVEDDLVTSKHFLEYMNEALDLYDNDVAVASIHGYVYPVNKELPETFFIRGADCWGWATWKRGWDLFERNGSKLLAELREKNLTKSFDFDGCYPYTRMLEDQVAGKNNSWAIRWYASAFLANKLTLYPGKSLVSNIGNDGSGTHCADMSEFDAVLSDKKVALKKLEIEENVFAREEIKKFFKPRKSFFKKISHKIQKKLDKKKKKREKYGWFSTDLSWSEARLATSGYDDGKILEKCKNALLKVKNGEAVFERDSVIFDKIEYSYPVLSSILLAAAKNSGKLNIIDFGGSLGSVYFQNRKFISQFKEVSWNIIEQNNFVECGKKYFQDENLKFYHDIDECFASKAPNDYPNAILLSSVIQYLENPYQFLENEILSKGIEFLIFDLTGFHNEDRDVLTIQRVWPEVYEASYPCWFFSKSRFFEVIGKKYELIEEFDSYFGSQINIDEKPQAKYLGAIFRLKNDA